MLQPGIILQSRYQILQLLGQGGMGAVYLARDHRLNQLVALKENSIGNLRQFYQEAQILARLRHPNLPRVSDHFVESNGAQYLVMDYVEGEDLETMRQRHGALPEAEIRVWLDQILDALVYLHSQNVIHRDIKPENIKLTPSGQVMLVDFGIAKVYQTGQLTRSSQKFGSPGYASPEHYRGGTDQRSDIYSLGATIYALLTGRIPPDALSLESGSAILASPRVLNRGLSEQITKVILQAMEVRPSARWQDAATMRFGMTDTALPANRNWRATFSQWAVAAPILILFCMGTAAIIGIGTIFTGQIAQFGAASPTAVSRATRTRTITRVSAMIPTPVRPSNTMAAPTETALAQSQSVSTQTGTPLVKTVTFTPVPPTLTHTPIRVRPTVSPTLPRTTPLSSPIPVQIEPTFTPVPASSIIYEPPTLHDPPDGSNLTRSTILRWSSPHQLAPDQEFDVLVWPDGSNEQTSIGTTTAMNFSIEFGAWKYAGIEGKFYWTIRIKHVTGEYLSSGVQPLSFFATARSTQPQPIEPPKSTDVPPPTDSEPPVTIIPPFN